MCETKCGDNQWEPHSPVSHRGVQLWLCGKSASIINQDNQEIGHHQKCENG